MTSTQSILFVIPHYFGPSTLGKRHGAFGANLDIANARAAKIRRTIETIHQVYGAQQCMMQLSERRTVAANTSIRANVSVIVCTDGVNHLLDDSGLSESHYRQLDIVGDSKHLGFACHRVMLERLHEFDWFVYLEDDLLLADALLLDKLGWFIEIAGEDAVLLPNRFERLGDGVTHKAYVDGELSASVTMEFQDLSDRPIVQGECLGKAWRFNRAANPHSGCFCLRRDQLQRVQRSPAFASPSDEFVGPLESAASLAVMQTFRVYKPAVESAAFLEVEHQSSQFISQLRRPE